MSLINDALKRARLEALRQEETEARTYRAVPAQPRRRDRQRLLLVGGWIAAALAVALAAWTWLAAGSGATPEAESIRPEVAAADRAGSTPVATRLPQAEARPDSVSPAEAMAPPDPGDADPASATAGDAISAEAGAPISGGEASRARATETPPRSSGASEASPVPRDQVSAELAAGASRTPARPEAVQREPSRNPSRAGGRRRLEAGETYLRSATAADGSSVELGGIAYSTSRPIAVINGSVVSNGDLIAGFTVISIEPERVELEADGVRIFLALH